MYDVLACLTRPNVHWVLSFIIPAPQGLDIDDIIKRVERSGHIISRHDVLAAIRQLKKAELVLEVNMSAGIKAYKFIEGWGPLIYALSECLELVLEIYENQ